MKPHPNHNTSWLQEGASFINECVHDEQLCKALAFAVVGIFLTSDYDLPTKVSVTLAAAGMGAMWMYKGAIHQKLGDIVGTANEFFNDAAAKATLGR